MTEGVGVGVGVGVFVGVGVGVGVFVGVGVGVGVGVNVGVGVAKISCIGWQDNAGKATSRHSNNSLIRFISIPPLIDVMIYQSLSHYRSSTISASLLSWQSLSINSGLAVAST